MLTIEDTTYKSGKHINVKGLVPVDNLPFYMQFKPSDIKIWKSTVRMRSMKMINRLRKQY